MSQLRCPYCGGSDGRTTTSPPFSTSASSLFVKECKSCGRFVEEHLSDVQEMFVERAQDTPLCIVTPDFSNNAAFHTPPLDDDPFESIGFITAFSTWSLELSPLFTSTTSSICGYLAELERMLLDPHGGCAPPANNTETVSAPPVVAANVSPASNGSNMVENLRAYFHILEVSSLLGLDRDISDHALQMFRDCSAAACLRNRNVEALATAALVQASREAKEVRTLQEISTAANISQKEIHRYMKILTDALKLSQPIDSNSISVYMPRFCSILELDKVTQLEDKRKTQTEICKATALTEVTLRKVYKELIENINDLLPIDYTPVVPLEKAFSVPGSNLSRIAVNKSSPNVVGSSVHPVVETSVSKTISSPGISRNRSGGSETSSKAVVSQASSENVPHVSSSNSVRLPAASASGLSDMGPWESSDKHTSKSSRFNRHDLADMNTLASETNVNASSSSKDAGRQPDVPFSTGSAGMPLAGVSTEVLKRDSPPIFDRERLHTPDASCLDAQDGSIKPTSLTRTGGSTNAFGDSASSLKGNRGLKAMEGSSSEKHVNSLQQWLMQGGATLKSEKEKLPNDSVPKTFGPGASTRGSNKAEPILSLWQHHSRSRASGEDNENFKSLIIKNVELVLDEPLAVPKPD